MNEKGMMSRNICVRINDGNGMGSLLLLSLRMRWLGLRRLLLLLLYLWNADSRHLRLLVDPTCSHVMTRLLQGRHLRFKLNAVLAFWIAYILTRPLGASLGDYFSQLPEDGGLGLGTIGTSAIFLIAIFVTVAYLTMTRKDAVAIDAPDTATAA